jgi:hypothetical protein
MNLATRAVLLQEFPLQWKCVRWVEQVTSAN